MIVYDVTNQETFESYMGESEHISIKIIGNKIDSYEREVKFEDAESFWKEKDYPYFETSSKTGENIDSRSKFG